MMASNLCSLFRNLYCMGSSCCLQYQPNTKRNRMALNSIYMLIIINNNNNDNIYIYIYIYIYICSKSASGTKGRCL